MRNSPVNTQGNNVLQVLELAPLQPMERTMVRQAVPLQPVEVNGGADIHTAAHRGPHAGAGALKEAAVQREPTPGQAPGRNSSPWRGPHARADRKSVV